MRISLNIPWNRYGLIVELADRLKDICPQLGKTVLQKMVYLLQEVFDVNSGYEFRFYTYGPFSSQLLQDLDLVDSLKGVNVHSVFSGIGGYHIILGERNQTLREKAKKFLSDPRVLKAINSLIKNFGHYSARDLELRSTIVYIDRDYETSRRTSHERKTCSDGSRNQISLFQRGNLPIYIRA